MNMCTENELDFCIFLIHQLAIEWNILPNEVYQKLSMTGILDEYIIPSYDCLHTLGKEYLIEDITEFMHEKGAVI